MTAIVKKMPQFMKNADRIIAKSRRSMSGVLVSSERHGGKHARIYRRRGGR